MMTFKSIVFESYCIVRGYKVDTLNRISNHIHQLHTGEQWTLSVQDLLISRTDFQSISVFLSLNIFKKQITTFKNKVVSPFYLLVLFHWYGHSRLLLQVQVIWNYLFLWRITYLADWFGSPYCLALVMVLGIYYPYYLMFFKLYYI